MTSKTDSSIDIAKKWPMYVCLTGSKVVLYPQQFPFSIMINRHFNTVNALNMVESGYSQTWRVPITLQIWWNLGIIYTIVLTGPFPWWDKDRWVSPIIAKAKMGSGEAKRWVLQQNNYTRVQWRQNSWAKRGEDRKCMHTMCLHAPHTPHTPLKDCKAECQNPQTLNTTPLLGSFYFCAKP